MPNLDSFLEIMFFKLDPVINTLLFSVLDTTSTLVLISFSSISQLSRIAPNSTYLVAIPSLIVYLYFFL